MKLNEAFELIDEVELMEIFKTLVRIPGHVKYDFQEKEISECVADILKKENIDTAFQEVEPGRSNVIGIIKGRSKGKSLALNGHLDTVPPNDSMESYEPKVQDTKIYGLGTSDMKGGIAAMLYSLIIIKRLGIELDGDLYFIGVIGEESGGTGTRFLINKGFKTDYFIIGEPTELKIVNSHKGCLQLDVIIEGKAAHGSTPEKGANAIAAMGNFIYKLNNEYIPELNKRAKEGLGSPTINFGTIQGGSKVNVIADKCLLEIDRRWISSENKEMLTKEIEIYLEDVCKENKDLKFYTIPKLPPDVYLEPLFLPENHELVKMCKDALIASNREPVVTRMPCWTDGATTSHAGIPTIILGPGSLEQAHTADEWIYIAEVVDAVKIYLSLIFRICINQN